MKSWLNRSVADRRLAVCPSLPLPREAKEAMISFLDDPAKLAAWERETLPELPLRLAEALTRQRLCSGLSGLVIAQPEGLWRDVLLSCGAPASRFYVSFIQPGLDALALAAEMSHLHLERIFCREDTDFLLLPGMFNSGSRLLATAYPHPLSGAAMPEDKWHNLCQRVISKQLRLLNYNRTVGPFEESSLASVACQYGDSLSWLEIYDPCATVGRDQGWSLVAAVGSADFVSDLRQASRGARGLFAPMAAALLDLFEGQEGRGSERLASIIESHQETNHRLARALGERLRLVSGGRAGYFIVCQVPQALGKEDINGDSFKFNELMLKDYGLGGLPLPHYAGGLVAYSPIPSEDLGYVWPEDFPEAIRCLEAHY